MPLWKPIDLVGTMALWLDAADAATFTHSGGVVSEWRDKSANARHAVQADNARRPRIDTGTINGLPVVRKTGLTQNLAVNMGATFASPTSTFFVTRFLQTLGYASAMTTTNADDNLNGFAFQYRRDNNTWATYPLYDSGVYLEAFGTSAKDVAYQFGVTMPAVGNQGFVYVSGTPLTMVGTVSALLGANHTHLHPLSGNSHPNGSGFSANLDFAEAVIYQGVLGTAERQLVEGYLAHKWGLAGSLAADHPYKAAAPSIGTTFNRSAAITAVGTVTATWSRKLWGGRNATPQESQNGGQLDQSARGGELMPSTKTGLLG